MSPLPEPTTTRGAMPKQKSIVLLDEDDYGEEEDLDELRS